MRCIILCVFWQISLMSELKKRQLSLQIFISFSWMQYIALVEVHEEDPVSHRYVNWKKGPYSPIKGGSRDILTRL